MGGSTTKTTRQTPNNPSPPISDLARKVATGWRPLCVKLAMVRRRDRGEPSNPEDPVAANLRSRPESSNRMAPHFARSWNRGGGATEASRQTLKIPSPPISDLAWKVATGWCPFCAKLAMVRLRGRGEPSNAEDPFAANLRSRPKSSNRMVPLLREAGKGGTVPGRGCERSELSNLQKSIFKKNWS
jgi:hypothetical protein